MQTNRKFTISSLDENHIFFIYSLIRSHILDKQQFEQLFISTHSLSFLKYLKKITTGMGNIQRAYFIVDRSNNTSTVERMPKHLKEFATEFHYLFHRIYRCSKANEDDDNCADDFYSFGNNLRKFLEMYLYFRYPNASENDTGKLRRFLGDDLVASSVTERVENEYSHLVGLFERGILPVDISAMKKMADLVLDKIKNYDPEQYNALMESIGEMPRA